MGKGRQWQVFVAPGEETTSLPIEASPWHDERWVRIPKEHWDLILNFAETLSPEKAQKLENYSWAVDDNEYNSIYISKEELMSLLAFIEELSRKIQTAAPLVPEPTEEIPDDYENEEYVRMLDALATVFRESIRLEQPFRAWVD